MHSIAWEYSVLRHAPQATKDKLDEEIKQYCATCPQRDTPVILVGNHAEKRLENSSGQVLGSLLCEGEGLCGGEGLCL